MAGLIRDLRSLDWTAVKITQYGHGICSQDGKPCSCAPNEHAFVLTEEHDAAGLSDTSRFLSAGARRSLWLRVRQGQLAEALPLLGRGLGAINWVMMESNSVMDFIDPTLYLAVLDCSQGDFKPSALKFLDRADAFIPVGSNPVKLGSAWPMIDSRVFENKPVFAVERGSYSSPELSEFVRLQMLAPHENNPADICVHPF
jgi:hypothetical protein